MKPDQIALLAGRRTFLGNSVALGVCATFSPLSSHAVAAEMEAECKPSAADALILYLDLLIQVQSDAFSAAAVGVLKAAKDCSDLLDKLYEKIDRLQEALRDSPARAQATQMRNSVDVARAHVDLMKASIGSAHSGNLALASTLTFFKGQIEKASVELPQGTVLISERAKALIDEIIQLVQDFEKVPEETKAAQLEFQRKLDLLRTSIAGIRDNLFAASAKAADAEMSPMPEDARNARTQAIEQIDQAIAKLQSLKGEPQPVVTANGNRAPAAAELLAKVLEGTKKWLLDPSSITKREKGNEDVQYVSASFANPPAIPISVYSRVQRAIDMHCPRGTTLRTLWCSNLILGPLAYRDRGTRASLIAGVLVLFTCWGHDKSALTAALAEIET